MIHHEVSKLAELVDYNPETGVLTWKKRQPWHFNSGLARDANAWNRKYVGAPVGRILKQGYMQTMVCGERVMVHRLAWMLFHNQRLPIGAQVDHINGNKIDNRIANLRLCTASQNQSNRENLKKSVRGAHFHKPTGKWQASIKIHLGTYETEQEAASAFESIAEKLQGEFYLPNGRRINVRGGATSL